MEDDFITIEKARFYELLEAEGLLDALYEWGVDNWDCFDDARATFNARYGSK